MADGFSETNKTMHGDFIFNIPTRFLVFLDLLIGN